ncbi:MAG: hypothetical protein V4527_13925 [Pseudomonadota bacterium]
MNIAHLVVPSLWLGLLVGVSFVATPVKFSAASLSLPVALDIGRVTFAVFDDIEWVMLAALVAAIVLSGSSPASRMAAMLLAVALLLQSAWLLPVLNQRVAAIIAGNNPSPSLDHIYYIAADVAKAILLVAIVWNEANRMVRASVKAR